MDGNCKAGLNSSVNVNVVDRVVFRFHKVIVYHVVKLLRSKDWAQLNFRQQRMLAEFLIWSIPFAFCCVTCSTNSIFTQRTRHVFRYPSRGDGHLLLLVGKCLPAWSLFFTKPTWRVIEANGIPLMNFGWKWDKKIVSHSKTALYWMLELALAWQSSLIS